MDFEVRQDDLTGAAIQAHGSVKTLRKLEPGNRLNRGFQTRARAVLAQWL